MASPAVVVDWDEDAAWRYFCKVCSQPVINVVYARALQPMGTGFTGLVDAARLNQFRLTETVLRNRWRGPTSLSVNAAGPTFNSGHTIVLARVPIAVHLAIFRYRPGGGSTSSPGWLVSPETFSNRGRLFTSLTRCLRERLFA